MPINCVKIVQKFVKKSAQKLYNKNVQKCGFYNILHIMGGFYNYLLSFAQKNLTIKNWNFNLLNVEFYTFYTDLTNTNKYKEGF